ncbi:MAG: DUF1036 domain-containing protein [Pseudolabrys sp.]
MTDNLVTALPFTAAKRQLIRLIARIAVPAVLLAASGHPALADFRLCNNTGGRVGGRHRLQGMPRAGRRKAGGTFRRRTCDTLLRGALVARYYYIYAVDYDRGGRMVRSRLHVLSRGKNSRFAAPITAWRAATTAPGSSRVDTTEQRSWTVQLTDSAEQAPERPLPEPHAGSGASTVYRADDTAGRKRQTMKFLP